MVRQLLFVIILWLGLLARAQNKQLMYDFTEIPQALLLNPGMETDFKWYSGIPTLSGLSIQAGSNGLSVNDLFANDGLDFNDKVRDKVIQGMSYRDEFSSTLQLEILNGGYRSKDPSVFYSFGVYAESDVIMYWPKDYGILAFEGNADKLNERFDLGHLNARGEVLSVFHFGMNKRMDNNLILGARGKIYSSILDFNSTNNTGYFETTDGQNNILSNTLRADMQLRTSGINAIETAEDDGNVPATIVKRGFFGGNLGLGLDLGFTYHFNRQMVLTGSLLDLGFIYHANAVENFTLDGSATTEGIEIILPDALLNPTQDFWEDLVDEIEALVPFEETTKSYMTFRPTRLYASLRYNFGESTENPKACDCDYSPSGRTNNILKYRNSVGGQLYVIKRPRGPQGAITAFYQRRFGNFMATKATYTVDKFTFTNVGLGISLQAGPINLYLMADNLLAYRNIAASNYASFQFGLNIISWEKK